MAPLNILKRDNWGYFYITAYLDVNRRLSTSMPLRIYVMNIKGIISMLNVMLCGCVFEFTEATKAVSPQGRAVRACALLTVFWFWCSESVQSLVYSVQLRAPVVNTHIWRWITIGSPCRFVIYKIICIIMPLYVLTMHFQFRVIQLAFLGLLLSILYTFARGGENYNIIPLVISCYLRYPSSSLWHGGVPVVSLEFF